MNYLSLSLMHLLSDCKFMVPFHNRCLDHTAAVILKLPALIINPWKTLISAECQLSIRNSWVWNCDQVQPDRIAWMRTTGKSKTPGHEMLLESVYKQVSPFINASLEKSPSTNYKVIFFQNKIQLFTCISVIIST